LVGRSVGTLVMSPHMARCFDIAVRLKESVTMQPVSVPVTLPWWWRSSETLVSYHTTTRHHRSKHRRREL